MREETGLGGSNVTYTSPGLAYLGYNVFHFHVLMYKKEAMITKNPIYMAVRYFNQPSEQLSAPQFSTVIGYIGREMIYGVQKCV